MNRTRVGASPSLHFIQDHLKQFICSLFHLKSLLTPVILPRFENQGRQGNFVLLTLNVARRFSYDFQANNARKGQGTPELPMQLASDFFHRSGLSRMQCPCTASWCSTQILGLFLSGFPHLFEGLPESKNYKNFVLRGKNQKILVK